ncbi:MAG: SusC/RagA family protein [Alistipes sp.]|nr:SusC/RagA family protein [Alistipes sp.]
MSSTAEIHNAFVMPSFQNKYGTGLNSPSEGSNSASWGELLVDKYNKKYSPRQDFLQTGTVFTNSVSVSTGTQKSQFYISAAAVNSEGIVPNNFYDRYNFTFRNTTKFFKDRMTMDVSGTYILQKDQNMVNQGVYGNPIVPAYLFPRGDDFDLVKVFERYDASRKIYLQYWPQGAGDYYMQIPYWIAHRNLRISDKHRYLLSANLSYNITDWLNVLGRIKIDNYSNDFEEKLYASTLTTLAQSEKGFYGKTRTLNKQTYADALVNINKTFNDFSLFANIGASFSHMKSDGMTISGPLERISNVFQSYNINRDMVEYNQSGWAEETQSVFASVELGYKSTYYLTLTGRNDWASQLANSSNTSFFYPSVGLSTILSEIWTMPEAINYLKVRGSFSSVGSPYPRGLTSLRYSYSRDQDMWNEKTHYPIKDLLPERTDSWEVGLSARLWRHVNVDLSLYTARTYHQTFDPQLSVSSKYETLYMQTGSVRNQGIELTAGYDNSWNDFRWSSAVVFSANRNKILELVNNRLHPETGEYITKEWLNVGGLGRAAFILKTGGTLGDLYSTTDLMTDSRGYIYVSPGGEVSLDPDTKQIKLGSVFPKGNLSWRNDFSWNNINLGFMFAARFGGIVYSATQAALDATGTSKASTVARDMGGVLINGSDMISAQNWYTVIGSQSGLPQYYVYSATNVRLQEASIGYTIPRSKLNDVMDITVSVVGRNLWIIYCKAPYDPESVATTGNYYQGIDSFMIPTTRSIGFNVRLKF